MMVGINVPYSKIFWRIWQLRINLTKFYLPTFCFTLISYVEILNLQMFFRQNVLGNNLPKYFTVCDVPSLYVIMQTCMNSLCIEYDKVSLA